MELLAAVKKLNRLEDEANKIDNWLAELSFGPEDKRKPVHGQTWFKLEKAIKDVMYELMKEHRELEDKIKKASDGIQIE